MRRQKVSTRRRIVAVLAAIGLLVTACGNGGGDEGDAAADDGDEGTTDEETTDEEITIGALFPRSGPLSRLGEESYVGADIAREMVNEQGGVNGAMVSFATGDAEDATAAKTEATRLIEREGVEVIIGSYASSVAMAATEDAERAGVVYWETIAVADDVTERGFENTFRLTFNAGQMGEAAAEFAEYAASELGIESSELRVAVVGEDSDFGTSVSDGAVNKVNELGFDLVAEESYSADVTDLSTLVLRLRERSPDVIIATSYLQDAILFWRQAREYELEVSSMIGVGTGYALPDFVEAHGSDVDGMFNVDAPNLPQLDAMADDVREDYEEFLDRFRERVGREPGPLATIAYQGTRVLLEEVMPEAGNDAEAIAAVARTLDLPLGTLPTGAGVSFDENNQNQRAVVSVMQWQDEELSPVWPDDLALTEIRDLPLPPWSER